LSLTTGGANTAIGAAALLNNTSGSNNTANGTFALFQNTTGGSNTATGFGTPISTQLAGTTRLPVIVRSH
jgi:hypothetical protein